MLHAIGDVGCLTEGFEAADSLSDFGELWQSVEYIRWVGVFFLFDRLLKTARDETLGSAHSESPCDPM